MTAHEVDEHAGAAKPGDQAAHPGRSHLPQPAELFALVRALAVEIHENWLEATRHLNMDHLREHKKENLRALAA